jgi:exoribonuclease R
MGKMKQMYEQQTNINQLNNNEMSRKTNKEQVEATPETREDALRRLFKENNLVKEDVYKDKRGFVIITRSGIDKIVSKQGITVAYEVVTLDLEKNHVVLKAVATMKVGKTEVRNMMSFGEASDNNLMGGGKKFPVAMAEKRAMSRVVLKLAGFYEQGNVFGQDEIVD